MRPDEQTLTPSETDMAYWWREVHWRELMLRRIDLDEETRDELTGEIADRYAALRRAGSAAARAPAAAPQPVREREAQPDGRKLSDDDVRAIRRRFGNAGETCLSLATEFDVGDATVRRVAHRQSYRDVPDEPHVTMGGRAKLSDEQVLQIRQRIEAGEKRIALANEYDVSLSAIDRVMRGTAYQHVVC